ncbi:hypothetical protein COU78_02275 [Candidatus Peregrinibacteria bacterium CG10_big_fil_rev_8_21_14_0_10_49_24]|nr:MAG: hypothetical protein COV83_02255 [Candidatus Peregrinibacteria bacterium CG11_big_fil_rev_8_21_14_0_20_49_14]PIR50964.1 MAG: hypothetical protein COU78_02275 [Candidatus Peregrinibacteria bacterium CG10_big_fil_rev_8_21_14_0_10_49_24]PJA67517.1 MAG: hypothetical protein CO157_03755 [Candidatus Peregrinibacteria bacterium CG_4_9_14_3_um_filter_49_12]
MDRSRESNWLLEKLRCEVSQVDAAFIVEPERVLPLPDRTIVSAWIQKRCQTVIRLGDEILHESTPKVIQVCKITLNTGKGVPRPIDVSDVHDEAAIVVMQLMNSLQNRQWELLRKEEG